MKHCIFPILIALFIFSSCVHHSPFDEEYYFQAMGESSELVVTADINKLEESSLDILPAEGIGKTLISRGDRVSVGLQPRTLEKYPLELSDYDIYGGFEGNYGSFTINTALSWSKEFEKEKKDGVKYYTNGALSVAVPKSGLLLFSTSDYLAAYKKTFSERVKLIEDEIAQQMASATAAIFVRTPQTLLDLGFELPDSVIKQIFTSYFMLDEVDGKVLLNGKLIMYDKSGARTMNTILRNQIIQTIKRSGQKVDIKAISGYFTFDENIVTIDSFPLEGEMKAKALGIINQSLKELL